MPSTTAPRPPNGLPSTAPITISGIDDDEVGEAHEHGVGPAAVVAGDRADHDADRRSATTPTMTMTMSDCCAPRMTTAKMSRPTSS